MFPGAAVLDYTLGQPLGRQSLPMHGPTSTRQDPLPHGPTWTRRDPQKRVLENDQLLMCMSCVTLL